MDTELTELKHFVGSLTPRQRRYFLLRETQIQTRLQSGMRDLARGLSEVSALNAEALSLTLEST